MLTMFRDMQVHGLAAVAALWGLLALSATAQTVDVIEYYNASQDHYFISSLAADINALDTGQFKGWARSGLTFKAFPVATMGASPVCRFYIPPAQGDSHFYSASPVECAQTAAKFPTFIEESPNVMYVDLPNTTTGTCPSGDVAVYRVWDNRVDSNHRYTTWLAIRSQMVAKGWIAEGYGPNQVIMCSPYDLRGIFIYTEHLARDHQQVMQALTLPGVDGITLLQGWFSFEPSKDTYDWTQVDGWISAAIAANKKVTLAIRAGQDTPCWLFTAPQCGTPYAKPYAGANPLTFLVSARQGVGQATCNSETIAAPWDPVFLSEWDAMLTALAAHLKNAGTYTAIASIRLTGVNRTTAELRLPEEILSSPCVTNSIQTWLQAPSPYRPGKLLQAWDAVTSSFLKNFPDKYFGLEIVPDTTGNASYPFPEIDDNGCVYSLIVPPSSVPNACVNNGPLPDQIAPLVQLANQKFLGHLAVSFQNLDSGQPANIYPIQTAQSLGTTIGYQTNDYNNLQQAACSGGSLNPGACTSTSYLELLEVGIYPLGKTDSLRAQYIEVLPPDAIAFPSAILQAHGELVTSP